MSEIILPGFVDIHDHFREPSSKNLSETYANATRMMLASGYAVATDMPNTPGRETWYPERLEEKHSISQRKAWIAVGQHVGSQPESNNISYLAKLSRTALGLKFYFGHTTGVDHDYSVDEFRDAAQEWHRVAPNKPILAHAVGGELVKEVIGLVAQDLKHPLHICHTHHPDEVRAVDEAKQRGLETTIGVTFHHLFMTSYETKTKGWFAEMMPALSAQQHAEELSRMLVDGAIDMIETDYAPHAKEAKWKAESENPQRIDDPKAHTTCFGVGGIEHAVPMMLRQAKLGNISYERLTDVMSTAPAKLLGIEIGESTRFRWNTKDYRIETEDDMISGAKWSPYLGSLASGRIIDATIGGRTVIADGKPIKQHHEPLTQRGVTI